MYVHICPFFNPHMCMCHLYMSVYSNMYHLYMYLSIDLSIYLSIDLSICLSTDWFQSSIYLSIYLSINLSLTLPVFYLSIIYLSSQWIPWLDKVLFYPRMLYINGRGISKQCKMMEYSIWKWLYDWITTHIHKSQTSASHYSPNERLRSYTLRVQPRQTIAAAHLSCLSLEIIEGFREKE